MAARRRAAGRHRRRLRGGLRRVQRLRGRDGGVLDRARHAFAAAGAARGPRLDGARRGARGRRPPDRRARTRAQRAPIPLRPPLPVPHAVDGALAARGRDRCTWAQYAGQRCVREHHAGARGGRGLDPHRPLPARARRGRRRRDLRVAAALDRIGLPGGGRRGDRRGRRRRRAAVRCSPPRDDPGDGRGRHRRRERRGGARARHHTDLRPARRGHRQQRLPRHTPRRRAHRRGDGGGGPPGGGARGLAVGDRAQCRVRLPRDLHAPARRRRRRRDPRPATRVRRRRPTRS